MNKHKRIIFRLTEPELDAFKAALGSKNLSKTLRAMVKRYSKGKHEKSTILQ